MHVRQTVVPTLETIDQPPVLDVEAVEDRALEIVNMDRRFHDAVAVLAGFSDDRAALDSAAGHPNAECASVVIVSKER